MFRKDKMKAKAHILHPDRNILHQKEEIEAFIAINPNDYGKSGDIYLCLWHYMVSATAIYGFTFDRAFKEKVIPSEHWRHYVEKFVKLLESSSNLEQAPWDNSSQLLEHQEKMNRVAWRCWQCFQSLEKTLLTTTTVLSYIDLCLKRETKIIKDELPRRKVRRLEKFHEATV